MNTWEEASEPRQQKVGRRTVTHKSFMQPDGKVGEYTTLGSPSDEFAGVIALTHDNQVVVVEQFRPGPAMLMQEIPGGGVERDETPQAAAMRELREESGYTSDDVEYLGAARKDAYMNGVWHFYLARNCVKTASLDLDDEEFVEVKLITVAELIKNAKESNMSDAVAVLMAYDTLIELNAVLDP